MVLVKAAIQLLATGKPAKIKDRNIGGRLVARVKDICLQQRVKYDIETFIRVSVNYEKNQRRRLQDFPNSENPLLDLTDMLEAIRALFQAYEPDTVKAWKRIVENIFDESGYSPISLYTIHSGKGGEGQVSFIIYPKDLPCTHPKQVPEEKEQEDHLLYVALTRTLADGAEGSGVLYLVYRETDERDDDDKAHERRGKVKWPEWLPKKYRQLWNWDKSNELNPPEKCLDTTSLQDILESPQENCLDTLSEVNLVEDDIIPVLAPAELRREPISAPDTNLDPSHERISVAVSVPQVKGYERVVTSRAVTFTCEQCGQTVTQERMPGPLPSHCSDRCRLDAAAARKKAVRALTGMNLGKRGRPRKAEAGT